MVERLGAAVTLDLPVAFITEARWIRDTLAELRPDARCYLVRNGIDKSIFPAADGHRAALRGPLRILIEGNPSVALKGIQDAVASVAAMREPRHVTVVTTEHEAFAGGPIDRVVGPVPHRDMATLYAETDVVLKTSRVEGMFGPPLEGFHLGATCVVTEVTGHEEYVQHGWNGLVARLGRPARHRAAARPARERPARAALPAHERARDGAVVARLGAGGPVHDAGDRAHPPRPAAARDRRHRAADGRHADRG